MDKKPVKNNKRSTSNTSSTKTSAITSPDIAPSQSQSSTLRFSTLPSPPHISAGSFAFPRLSPPIACTSSSHSPSLTVSPIKNSATPFSFQSAQPTATSSSEQPSSALSLNAKEVERNAGVDLSSNDQFPPLLPQPVHSRPKLNTNALQQPKEESATATTTTAAMTTSVTPITAAATVPEVSLTTTTSTTATNQQPEDTSVTSSTIPATTTATTTTTTTTSTLTISEKQTKSIWASRMHCLLEPVPIDNHCDRRLEEKRACMYRGTRSEEICRKLYTAATKRMTVRRATQDKPCACLNPSDLHRTYDVTTPPQYSYETAQTVSVEICKMPSCSCEKAVKSFCHHILFVLLFEFDVPDQSDFLFQRAFITSELSSLYRITVFPPDQGPPKKLKGGAPPEKRKKIDDACAICCDTMDDPSNVVWCQAKAGCGNNLHKECFNQWAESEKKAGRDVTCVYCRAPWLGIKKLTKRQKQQIAYNEYREYEERMGFSIISLLFGDMHHQFHHHHYDSDEEEEGFVGQDYYVISDDDDEEIRYF